MAGLRVLLIEDSAQDAALLLQELRKGGHAPVHLQVDTAEAMAAALEEQTWDIILADHAMPRFSAMKALLIAKERGLDTPFIIVSGVIDEEAAVEAMRAGAHDYLKKDNLARLNPAVSRELHEAVERTERRRAEEELRRHREHLEQLVEERTADLGIRNAQLAAEIGERKRAEEALRERENELRLIIDATPAVISYIDSGCRYRRVNKTYEQWFGLAADEIQGRHIREVVGESAYQAVRPYVARVLAGEKVGYQQELPLRGGGTRWVDATYVPDRDASGRVRGFVVLGVDIGKLKEAEERIRASLTEKEAAERARAELAENLNREINHRVKNNLTMMAGLLQMQQAASSNPEVATALRDAIGRILAVANLHGQLQAGQGDTADVLSTIRGIATGTRDVLGSQGISLSVEGDPVVCPRRDITSLAVMANELITNAIKHGAPVDGGELRVEVRLRQVGDDLCLSVWNSGNPVPPDFDSARCANLGLSLIRGLVMEQFQGSFTLRPHEGGTLAEALVPMAFPPGVAAPGVGALLDAGDATTR